MGIRLVLIRFYILLAVCSICCEMVCGQCSYSGDYQRKVKGSDYDMKIKLDTKIKKAVTRQVINWTNTSPDTVKELQFYLYLNAFKDLKSTYLKNSGGRVFGNDITKRDANEWGWVDIRECMLDGVDFVEEIRYIRPDDGNENDKSVMAITLDKPLVPGASIEVEMEYDAKLPKTIARVGYSRDDFYLFVHWFPQLGVFEEKADGSWGWNCHQFMQQTEFFGEFANYDVEITTPKELVLGGSGCKISESDNTDGTKTTHFIAKDVVNFAWSAYPLFDEYKDSWEGVDITMLIPPEHCAMAPRYLGALKNALTYFADHLGKYPYPSITLIDPPMHALNSGFMEYPMLITCASFHFVPDGIRTIESLAIHEFSHQYFMGILASNEKEEAWLDEGFVTYYEDEIMDQYYGGPNASVFDILGFKSGNKEQSRLEYTSLPDLKVGPIAQPGWKVRGGYKGIIYAKTATVLQTLKGLIGADKMKQLLKHYYKENKFTHPKEADWMRAVNEIVGTKIKGMPTEQFFDQCLHQTGICDYAVDPIRYSQEDQQSMITVRRLGELVFPQEILLTLSNGETRWEEWDGVEETYEIKLSGQVVSVYIDPKKKIYLDVNFINNSCVTKVETRPAVNYGGKALSWTQQLFQLASFLF